MPFRQPGLMEREGAESLQYPQNWFAVYTRSHHEKSVMQHLTDRGIENFCQLYSRSTLIVIAIPSATGPEMTRTLAPCHAVRVEWKTVPGLEGT